MATIRFDGPSIMAACNSAGIVADNNNNIATYKSQGYFLYLLSHTSDWQPGNRKFVLFHPTLPPWIIRAPLIKLLKQRNIPCGFSVEDALFYNKVYVVGPFEPADLTQLTISNVTLDTQIPYNSAFALRKDLESKL